MSEFVEDFETNSFCFRCDTFTNSFETFLENEIFTDVIFLCRENSPVTCHKVILASVSDYLRTLLEDNDQETVFISIPDVSDLTIKILLNILYGGETIGNKNEFDDLKTVLTLFGINLKNTSVSDAGSSVSHFVELNDDNDDERDIIANAAVDVKEICESEDPLNVPDFVFRKNVSGYKHETSSVKIEPEEPEYNLPQDPKPDFFGNCLYINEVKSKPNYSVLEEHNYFSYIIKKSPRSKTPVYTDKDLKVSFSAKQTRVDFTEKQLHMLEVAYKDKRLADKNCQKSLAINFGASLHTIYCWYYRRKRADKKKANSISSKLSSSDSPYKNRSNDSEDTSSTLTAVDYDMQEFNEFEDDHFNTTDTDPLNFSEADVKDPLCTDDIEIEENKLFSSWNDDEFPFYSDHNDIHPKDTSRTSYSLMTKVKSKVEEESRKIILTDEQRKVLEENYNKKKYPTATELQHLARVINAPKRSLYYWYNNQRRKDARLHRKDLKDKITTLGNAEALSSNTKKPNTIGIVKNSKNREKIRGEEWNSKFGECEYKDGRSMSDNQRKKRTWSRTFIQSGSTRKKKRPKLSSAVLIRREQHDVLEEAYKENKFPSKETQEKLAVDLGIPVTKVMNWFSRKRQDALTGGSRWRGYKVILTDALRDALDEMYKENNSPDNESLLKISEKLNLPCKYVADWFANRTRKNEEGDIKPTEDFKLFAETKRRNPASRNTRTSRIRLSDKHQEILEEAYVENKYLDKEYQQKLSDDLGLPLKIIISWFHNRFLTYRRGLKRKRFTESQLEILEKNFQNKKLEDKNHQEILAMEFGASITTVRCWYFRRKYKEETERGVKEKHRRSPSNIDRHILEKAYSQKKLHNKDVQEKIAKELKVPHYTVRNWYYRRCRKDYPASEKRLTRATGKILEALDHDSNNEIKGVDEDETIDENEEISDRSKNDEVENRTKDKNEGDVEDESNVNIKVAVEDGTTNKCGNKYKNKTNDNKEVTSNNKEVEDIINYDKNIEDLTNYNKVDGIKNDDKEVEDITYNKEVEDVTNDNKKVEYRTRGKNSEKIANKTNVKNRKIIASITKDKTGKVISKDNKKVKDLINDNEKIKTGTKGRLNYKNKRVHVFNTKANIKKFQNETKCNKKVKSLTKGKKNVKNKTKVKNYKFHDSSEDKNKGVGGSGTSGKRETEVKGGIKDTNEEFENNTEDSAEENTHG